MAAFHHHPLAIFVQLLLVDPGVVGLTDRHGVAQHIGRDFQVGPILVEQDRRVAVAPLVERHVQPDAA